MAEKIAEAVDSLEIYRVPRHSGEVWDFHIHWTAANGQPGCRLKSLPREHALFSLSRTLARIALTEQALTGELSDPLDVRIIINLQRPEPGQRLAATPEMTALMQLPGTRATIPIPIVDRNPGPCRNEMLGSTQP